MKNSIFYKPSHLRFTFLALLFIPPFLTQAASITADSTRPVMLCEAALNLTLPETFEPNISAVQLDQAYFNKGSKDNCRLIEFKVRRFYPAAVPTMIAAGYDTNGDGQLDAADGVDFNEDGDISDPGEFIEKKGARYWTPLQDEVEFFPIDTITSVSVELWGIDRVGAYNTCKTLVTVSSPTSNEQLLPPRLNLPQNIPLSRNKDKLYPSYPNPVNREALIYFDLQQTEQIEFKVFDQQGRSILSKKLDAAMGRNEIQIQRHELGAAKGLLYYSLCTAQGLLVQKMMVL